MANETQKETPRYNGIPKQVSCPDFNRYIEPHLSKRVKGPKPKISFYKIFNYILHVLHTGPQWSQLRTRRNELHWSNVYKWHNQWSKDGSYQIVSNNHRIAGMLMFISFATIVDAWVKLGSLAPSLRNSDKRVQSIAKPVAVVNHIFKETVPVFLNKSSWLM